MTTYRSPEPPEIELKMFQIGGVGGQVPRNVRKEADEEASEGELSETQQRPGRVVHLHEKKLSSQCVHLAPEGSSPNGA